MLTKQDIKNRLRTISTQINENLLPRVQISLATIEKNEHTIEEQSGAHLYSAYISYIRALREFGYVAQDVLSYHQQLGVVLSAIKRLISRIDRFFPDGEAKGTRLEFTEIATNLESNMGQLCSLTEELNDHIIRMADRYVRDPDFKNGIDQELSKLEPMDRQTLQSWSKPYIDYIYNIKIPNSNSSLYGALNESLATLSNTITPMPIAVSLRP